MEGVGRRIFRAIRSFIYQQPHAHPQHTELNQYFTDYSH